ncbi:MAG: aldehyde dehydrogenase family protein [Bacteroidetes bacterium HGW-Bacteroidetes-16]|jgi:aldehyde dehydrogenase (NAD+)|nr:MAG: aldehyde dehydrogenase family protein [Bacteroidetes bacterium HGW-Bacteroidetes-16]
MISNSEFISVFDRQGVFFAQQKTKPLFFRLEALRKLKAAILQYEQEIMQALQADLHKSNFESYATEIGFIHEEIGYHLHHLKHWIKPERVSSSLTSFPSKSMILSEPMGRVLIITPWNYPFQLVMAPLIGAISAGNTAIIKPSEISQHTAAIIQKILNAIFSDEFIAVFQGDASVSQALLKLKFDHVFFTGSPRVGQYVMQEAAKQLIPVTLELGGKSPCIVDRDVDIELAARRIAWGKFLNAGQTCIAPDYLMVHEAIAEKFLEALVHAIKTFYGDDPFTSEAFPRIITRENTLRLGSLINGCTVFYGGKFMVDEHYMEPTILTDVNPDMPVMQQEIFGPVLPVMLFSNLEEVVDFINKRPKPLALYCFSSNRKFIHRVLHEIPAGGVTINDTLMHISNNRLPFGGVGNSGMGHYHGKFSFDLFSHRKSVMVRATWLDIPLRYAPFGKKLNYLKMLMK